MIIAAKTAGEIREVKKPLKDCFTFTLGMEIDHDKNDGTLMIKQTRYIDDVVGRFVRQLNAKTTDDPCSSNLT
ncbi:polyprotein [Phytophthora megakarya]|uniref:Polyprotein n=1 Tax=Phytophthora megakarya TaxID=4795 RepID=A0A225VGY8_9STRA|nr:polyprotein [Phytophthora megakarya]